MKINMEYTVMVIIFLTEHVVLLVKYNSSIFHGWKKFVLAGINNG